MTSQTSSQKRSRANRDDFNEMSESERKSLVTEVVMYLLSQEASKVPTKRTSIVKCVLERHGRSFKQVIVEAKDVLKEVFGYQLIDCDNRYLLINVFSPSDIGSKILGESEEHKKRCVLLTLVLSLIFMEGGTVKDDEMWNFLRRLNILVDDLPDPVFGDVKKVLTKDFVLMLYLQHSHREGTDPPVYEFSSGPRADLEVSKRQLLKFVCMVYGNSEDDWPVQLKELEHIEDSEAQNISQLIRKRVRLSETPASQSSSSQHTSSRNSSQHRGRSPSPQPGPSSRA